VIGSSEAATVQNVETIVSGAIACDIPMYKGPFAHHGRNRGVSEADGAQYPVSFEADLPPLAVEHPARAWNSMLHSLGSNLQPVVKWEYERMSMTSLEDGKSPSCWRRLDWLIVLVDPQYLAHLTLILPPTHPAIAEHPLFRTLPKIRYLRSTRHP